MRQGCWGCTLKHLGEAAVYQTELASYPDFAIYVLGCLSHAEMESQEFNPELARAIRTWRIEAEENPNVQIPYEEFYRFIQLCRIAHESPTPMDMPDVWEELIYKETKEVVVDGPMSEGGETPEDIKLRDDVLDSLGLALKMTRPSPPLPPPQATPQATPQADPRVRDTLVQMEPPPSPKVSEPTTFTDEQGVVWVIVTDGATQAGDTLMALADIHKRTEPIPSSLMNIKLPFRYHVVYRRKDVIEGRKYVIQGPTTYHRGEVVDIPEGWAVVKGEGKIQKGDRMWLIPHHCFEDVDILCENDATIDTWVSEGSTADDYYCIIRKNPETFPVDPNVVVTEGLIQKGDRVIHVSSDLGNVSVHAGHDVIGKPVGSVYRVTRLRDVVEGKKYIIQRDKYEDCYGTIISIPDGYRVLKPDELVRADDLEWWRTDKAFHSCELDGLYSPRNQTKAEELYCVIRINTVT